MGRKLRNLNTGAMAFISSKVSDEHAVNSTVTATKDKLLVPNTSGVFN
jgi:hypothetical protein